MATFHAPIEFRNGLALHPVDASESPHRGRTQASRPQISPHGSSSQLKQIDTSVMERFISSSSGSPTSSTRSLATLRREQPSALTTMYRQGSICHSPTWSPRGSVAERTQAERDKREHMRKQRKEAIKVKKRLKEEQQRQKQQQQKHPKGVKEKEKEKEKDKAADGGFSFAKRGGRRVARDRPPVAMDTQRLPAALQDERVKEEGQSRRRRSSSISSMVRMITGGRSLSRSRAREPLDDDMYISDDNHTHDTTFVGGIKLRHAQDPVKHSPHPGDTMAPDQSLTDETYRRQQVIKPTNRSSTDPWTVSAIPANALRPTPPKTSARRQSMAISSADKDSQRSHKDVLMEKLIETKRQRQSRLPIDAGARVSDMIHDANADPGQKTTQPIRSAMKGARAAEGHGKAKLKSSPPAAPAIDRSEPNTTAKVSKQGAQSHEPSRAIAWWEDEEAVAKATRKSIARAQRKQPSHAATSFGPQMPPTPDASVHALTPSNDASEDVQKSSGYGFPTPPRTVGKKSPPVPQLCDGVSPVIWKLPIRANREAAVIRAEAFRGLTGLPARESYSDIDSLPSQRPKEKSDGNGETEQTDTSDNKSVSEKSELLIDLDSSSESTSDRNSLPQDLQADGIWRRAASYYSKTNADDVPKHAFLSREYSPADKVPPPPTQHPSLMALRSAYDNAKPPQARATHDAQKIDGDVNAKAEDSIPRPFSIVPTPLPFQQSEDLRTIANTDNRGQQFLASPHARPPNPLKSPAGGSRDYQLRLDTLVQPAYDDQRTSDRLNQRESHQKTADGERTSSKKSNLQLPAGRATPYTPAQSPRFANVATSYDAYRRAITNDAPDITGGVPPSGPQLSSLNEILSKPDPPFAREGRFLLDAAPIGNPVSANKSTHEAKHEIEKVPPPFTANKPIANTQHARTSRLSETKELDEVDDLDFSAKVFVICCTCRKWHDVPSSQYRKMCDKSAATDKGGNSGNPAMSKSRIPRPGGKAESDDERPDEEGAIMSGSSGLSSGSGTRVVCCWCQHTMSTQCCEGWTTVCFKRRQHHELDNGTAQQKQSEKRLVRVSVQQHKRMVSK